MKVISAREFGAIGSGVGDDTVALQEAWREASISGATTLEIEPGVYPVYKPLHWINTDPVNVEATGATLKWKGTDGRCLTYGAPYGGSIRFAQLHGLSIVSGIPDEHKWDYDSIGLVIQNLNTSQVEFGEIKNFRTNVVLSASASICAYLRLGGSVGSSIQGGKIGLTVEQISGGWSNAIVFDQIRFGGGTLGNPSPYDTAQLIRIPPSTKYADGWTFTDCRFETRHGKYLWLVDTELARCWVWRDCWFEAAAVNGPMQCRIQRAHNVTVRGAPTQGVAWPEGVRLVS